MQNERTSSVIRRRWCLLLAATVLLLASTAQAQEAATPESPPAPAAADSTDANKSNEADELARKRKLRLAILTGGLVAVTGMAMVGLTILGGSATRRGLRRKPLTEPATPVEPIPAERFDESETDNSARRSTTPRESSGEQES